MEQSLKAKIMMTMIKVREKDEQTRSKEVYKCVNDHFKETYGYKNIVDDLMSDKEMSNDSYFIRFINKYQNNEKYNRFLEDLTEAHLYLMFFD